MGNSAMSCAAFTRRQFLGAGLSWGLLSGCAAESVLRDDRRYSVSLIGDTHFDSPDSKFYHAAYVGDTSKSRFEAHLKEHVRNAEMWQERLPSLLAAAGACRRSDTAFVLQLGDLVQGDCGNGAMHRRMLEDAVAAVKKPFPGIPFVTVCGNHDIRGTGAQLAYNRFMPGVIGKELGVPVDRTTFSFRQGPDVFIVVDFNVKETVEPGLDYGLILRLLDESRDARYTFVVSHGPFFCTARWSLLGAEKQDAQRAELTRRLAERKAIVLAGHTHRMEFDECVFPEGRMTQAVVNSVWSKPDADRFTVMCDRPDQFGASVRALPETDRRRAGLMRFIDDRAKAMRTYWLAKGAGHAQLVVSDAGVGLAYFEGASEKFTRRVRMA